RRGSPPPPRGGPPPPGCCPPCCPSPPRFPRPPFWSPLCSLCSLCSPLGGSSKAAAIMVSKGPPGRGRRKAFEEDKPSARHQATTIFFRGWRFIGPVP